MNQCSPVAVHSLREAHACHAVESQLSAFSVPRLHTVIAINRERKTNKLKTDRKKGKAEREKVHRGILLFHFTCIEGIDNGGKNQCTGRPTAPVITRYRCFLPDLAGLAGLRRVGPGTETILSLNTLLRRPRAHRTRAKTCPHDSLQLTSLSCPQACCAIPHRARPDQRLRHPQRPRPEAEAAKLP
jgi:hypothetical protein